METLPVTLIVKAPNQQIEDQTIQCEPTWTIYKLKQHLSEVYPSKPPKHEQKLIYSGQLLSDSIVLKDVLRQYEGQETHTVHLVCTPKHIKVTKTESVPRTQATQQNNATATAPSARPTNLNNDTAENRVPNMPGYYPGAIDPAQYAVHLAWMQQAYAQYMNQYMQLAGSNPYVTGTPTVTPQSQPNIIPPQPARQANAANAEEAAAPQPPPAAPAPQQRDPENQERDWLDLFYIFSRVLVLFSVVYFYTSLLRFVFVLVLGFGLYLYQIGFFRNINNVNNNNNIVPPTETPGQEPEPPIVPEEQVPSRLMVAWTFVTTFFASLLPEIPNAI